MSIQGMYMLNTEEYTDEKIHQALDILYADRKNEFRTLSEAFLGKEKLSEMSNCKYWLEPKKV